jgi:GTP-binding protein Era
MAKSAFVAIVGRPSSGKSTLLNALCGAKVSIVSPVPQTTRNMVRGIVNKAPENDTEGGQLVFIDTPGFHISGKKLNQRLRDLAVQSLGDADLVVYLLDASRQPGLEEETLAKTLAPVGDKMLAAINKIDLPESDPRRVEDFLRNHFGEIGIVEISAKEKRGLDQLVESLLSRANEGPQWYPPDLYTDQEPAFRMAEIIREKATLHTHEEVPHAIFVDYRDSRRLGDGALEAEFDIVVERESQKGILIGKGGSMIRSIREEAEAELAELFDYPVRLRLQVRVDPEWRRDGTRLDKLIF